MGPGHRAGGSAARRALQASAALAVLGVLAQFVTAGHLLSTGSWLGAHSVGALVLHVLTGLAAAAALWWRLSGGPTWVVVLAAASFALTFPQAASGSYAPLSVHVPLSLGVAATTVWLLVVAFSPPGGRRAR
ncbi:hypothetical protein [Pseudokineococcus sp. 1T1Z-3]|uniref:hypothetical protein n=1 Tax=Pseudokineococcus sp. 1T1Z-3 TaxID=3132745 RepID=UPI0030B4DF49